MSFFKSKEKVPAPVAPRIRPKSSGEIEEDLLKEYVKGKYNCPEFKTEITQNIFQQRMYLTESCGLMGDVNLVKFDVSRCLKCQNDYLANHIRKETKDDRYVYITDDMDYFDTEMLKTIPCIYREEGKDGYMHCGRISKMCKESETKVSAVACKNCRVTNKKGDGEW